MTNADEQKPTNLDNPGGHVSDHAGLIALIDYGIGNLRSVEKALLAAGANVILTSSIEDIHNAEKIVLPGVGAFGDGMNGLATRNLIQALIAAYKQEKPFLGICLGLQLFFETSDEAPDIKGLAFLPGRVIRFSDPKLKIPHTGWNQIMPVQGTLYFNENNAGKLCLFQPWLLLSTQHCIRLPG